MDDRTAEAIRELADAMQQWPEAIRHERIQEARQAVIDAALAVEAQTVRLVNPNETTMKFHQVTRYLRELIEAEREDQPT